MTITNSGDKARGPIRKRGTQKPLWQVTGKLCGEQISWRVGAANEDEAIAEAYARGIKQVSKCEIAKPMRSHARAK